MSRVRSAPFYRAFDKRREIIEDAVNAQLRARSGERLGPLPGMHGGEVALEAFGVALQRMERNRGQPTVSRKTDENG